MGEANVVEQAAEGLYAHGSLADMLMAVELRAALGFGVVHVPDADGFKTDRCSNLADGFFVALGGDQVVAGYVGVAGIEADVNRSGGAETVDKLGYLLEAAAERELGTGCVLDQDVEAGRLPRETVDGAGDGVGGKFEAFIAREALPRAGMEHQVLGAQRQRSLDLSTKGGDALLANLVRLAADVDQVAGVYDQRAYVELGAKLFYAGGLRGVNFGSAPHARA